MKLIVYLIELTHYCSSAFFNEILKVLWIGWNSYQFIVKKGYGLFAILLPSNPLINLLLPSTTSTIKKVRENKQAKGGAERV